MWHIALSGVWCLGLCDHSSWTGSHSQKCWWRLNTGVYTTTCTQSCKKPYFISAGKVLCRWLITNRCKTWWTNVVIMVCWDKTVAKLMKWCSFGNLNITWHKTKLCCHMGISHYSIFQVPCHNLGAVNKVALITLLRTEFALMFIIIHSLIFLHFWLAQIPWLILDNQIWKMSVISWTMTSNSTGYQKKASQPRSPGDKVA